MGGRPKALLPTGQRDETFLTRIVTTLQVGGVDDVVVVTGYHDDAIGHAVELMAAPVRVVRNPVPDQGQLSSLLAALTAIDHPGVSAMLVTLVDLPLVSAPTVARGTRRIPADRRVDRTPGARWAARSPSALRPITF